MSNRLISSHNNFQNKLVINNFKTDGSGLYNPTSSTIMQEIYLTPSFQRYPINIGNFKITKADEYASVNLDFFTCMFCLHIANNPLCCQSCQGLFCEKCFKEKQKGCENIRCKKCNLNLIPKNLTFNMQNDLNNIKIKCPNSSCSISFPYIELKRHLESCKFTERLCECVFCKTLFLSKNEGHESLFHLRNCVLAKIKCEFCNQYFLRNTLLEHKNICRINQQTTINIHAKNISSHPPNSNMINKPEAINTTNKHGAYENSSFNYRLNNNQTYNYNNISDFSNSFSLNSNTFFVCDNKNPLNNLYNNNNMNINSNKIQDASIKYVSPNPKNSNFLTSNNTNLPAAYSNYTNSQMNISNLNRTNNDKYILESERSNIGNIDYLVSIENFHRQNQSEIKNLLKNKDLEISQIKKDYENKINTIINNNLDQNQIVKKFCLYEDAPLTLNDLRIDMDEVNRENTKNLSGEKNGISPYKNQNEINNDKDLSLIEYSFFKNELEKLEERNFANSQKDHAIKSTNTKVIKQHNKDLPHFNEENHNNKSLNDDLDIFEFSDNQIFQEENNPDQNKQVYEKDAKIREKGSQKREVSNEVNYNIIKNLHEAEKAKLKKVHEKEILSIKQECAQKFTEMLNQVNYNRLDNEQVENVLNEIQSNINIKDVQISNYDILLNKYFILFNENSTIKENYERNLKRLNEELKSCKTKSDKNINELNENKQKEIIKIIENNENTIVKIKSNYENLINLIRNEKDNDIKRLVKKYETDFQELKIKQENSIEKMKNDYKSQMEIVKKNYEVKEMSTKEINELKIKNLLIEKNNEFEAIKKDILLNLHKSLDNINIAALAFKNSEELKNIEQIYNKIYEALEIERKRLNEIGDKTFRKNYKETRKESETIIPVVQKTSKNEGDDELGYLDNSEFELSYKNEISKKFERAIDIEDAKKGIKHSFHSSNNYPKNEENAKIFKMIEIHENNLNERKKHFDNLIMNSLNNSNQTEKEKIKTVSPVVTYKEEQNINGNNVFENDNNFNLLKNDDQILLQNITEKLKIVEKILSEYTRYLEEISESNKKKIKVLIGKTQLEFNKINSKIFIDNGKSDDNKNENIKFIKEKLENEISKVEVFLNDPKYNFLKKQDSTGLNNRINAENTKSEKHFSLIELINNQKKSLTILKENYFDLKKENEKEMNEYITQVLKVGTKKGLEEAISKILDSHFNSKENEKLQEKDLMEIKNKIADLYFFNLAEERKNFDETLKLIENSHEKDKKYLIENNYEEMKNVSTHFENIIKANRDEAEKLTTNARKGSIERNSLTSSGNNLNIKYEPNLKKIEELENIVRKMSLEKKESDEAYSKKMEIICKENIQVVENLKLNKENEINQLTINFKMDLEKLRKLFDQERINTEALYENKIKSIIDDKNQEVENIKIVNTKHIEELKLFYEGIITVKNNELQEFKSISEKDINNLKIIYDEKLIQVDIENKGKIDLLIKNFEKEIVMLNEGFAKKNETLEELLKVKTDEYFYLKQIHDKVLMDLEQCQLKLKDFESIMNEEINKIKFQADLDIKNVIFSFKQKIENTNTEHKAKIDEINVIFESEKIRMHEMFDKQMNELDFQRKDEYEFILNKQAQEFNLFKIQHENDVDHISILHKDEIKQILDKSIIDINSLKQTYENKLNILESQYKEQIEKLIIEKKQIKTEYEKIFDNLNIEKKQLFVRINNIINSNSLISKSDLVVQLKNEIDNIKITNISSSPNGIDSHENLINQKNEEIRQLISENKQLVENHENIVKIELEKLNKFYVDEINKLRAEAKLNEEAIISNKNFEITNIKKALEEYLKAEKSKIIAEYEEKIQSINSNRSTLSQEDINKFKEMTTENIMKYYKMSFYKLKEMHSQEINNLEMKKIEALESQKKYFDVLITNIREQHIEEINNAIRISEAHEKYNIDAIDENKERILIDLLRERYSMNVDISDTPCLIALAYNIVKSVEKNRNKNKLLGIKKNRHIPGYGIAFYENGDVYEGEIHNNLPNGYGIFYNLRLSKMHEGFYENGKKYGKGTLHISESQLYEGEFKADKFHGKGILYSNGDVYNGDWLENIRSGFGNVNYSNGERYEGNFKDNLREGKGTLYKTNGEVYTGEWSKDIRKGQGVLTYPNGCKLVGLWDDELNNFDGKFYFNNNDMKEYYICKIENEKLVSKSDKIIEPVNELDFKKYDIINIEFQGKVFQLTIDPLS